MGMGACGGRGQFKVKVKVEERQMKWVYRD
jgi:hypothetical protein